MKLHSAECNNATYCKVTLVFFIPSHAAHKRTAAAVCSNKLLKCSQQFTLNCFEMLVARVYISQ